MVIVRGLPLTPASSREERRSFLVGWANRISQRLKETRSGAEGKRRGQARMARSSSSDKPGVIRAEMERLNIRIYSGTSLTRTRFRCLGGGF